MEMWAGLSKKGDFEYFFVFLGGGGDGWCRRHSSTMFTRHYVFGFSNVHDCALLSRLLRGWQ